MRHFHPTTVHLMRECATLFCKTKIDPYLYLERFIEVNKSFFVENAQVKFATLLLEADAAGGRDWNTWARDWGSWMKGGQGEMEKSRADVSYIYGQAMRHLNQLMGLISNNPEADDPKILNSLRMQLQSVSKTLTSIKPSIDTIAPKIMNVAFNKYKGINTPLAPSGDMASLKAVPDGKILETIANMIIKLNDPRTNDADKGSIQTTLNSIKTRQLPFKDYTDTEYTGKRDLVKMIMWTPNGPRYWGGLAPDQKNALIKFFGDEKQAQLAFAKFKYFRGLNKPTSDTRVPASQVKQELDAMKVVADDFESWVASNRSNDIKQGLMRGGPSSYTWKEKADHLLSLQPAANKFAKILEDRGLLSPIKQLYTTMANWFDVNPTTRVTQYNSLFGTPAAPTTNPEIKKQVAAVIAGIHQKTVGNNAAFAQLKSAYP
jgi:hypothetical protein